MSRPAIRLRSLLLASALLAGFGNGRAVANEAIAITATAAPTLDGRLDEPAWDAAPELTALRQITPQPGAEASVATQIRVLHDERYLYLGVVAHERDGERRVARQTARDAELDGDDHISIVIDPSGAGRNGYVFRVNANGALQDALIYDGGEEREDWDAIWNAQVHREADYWSVEIAIPFAALSGTREGAWGFNVERYRGGSGERLRWHGTRPDRPVSSLRDAGMLRIAGEIGSEGLGLRLKPSLRLARRDPGDTEFEPGLDVFWRLRPDTTATLTLNTDFADAEVDERQVNLTRFPLFFEEKREFFLQDAGVFSFGGLQLDSLPFFSRRAGVSASGVPQPLDGGLKLTHASQDLEAGLLAVRVGSDAGAPQADLGVARVAVRAGEHGRIGAIGTTGNPDGTSGSSLWGVDGQYRNPLLLGRYTLLLNGWTQTSRDAALGDGRAYGAFLDWPNLGLTGNVRVARIEAEYLPALGFVRETGVNKASGEIGWWARTAAGGDLIPQLDWAVTRGIDDPRRYQMLNPEIYLANAGGDYLMPELFFERERLIADFEIVPGLVIPAGDYRYDSVLIYAGIGARSLLSGEASLRFGEFYDGRREDVTLETTLRPSGRWGLSLRGEHTHLDLPAGEARVNLASLGLQLTPDPRLLASALAQWDDLSGEIGVNLRIRWTVKPGRNIFLSINRLFRDDRGLTELAAQETLKLAWNWQW